MKILLLILVALLPGCAYYEGQRVLNDPDCSFIGKPAEWRWPEKCGTLPSGTRVIVRSLPNGTYAVTK